MDALTDAEMVANKHRATFSQLGHPSPLGEGDTNARANTLKKGFRTFRKEAMFKNIRITATAADVFDDYFAGKPPFGQGRKKAEFPDAFVLRSLHDWAARHSTLIYVVSRDQDVVKFCEAQSRFIHLASLPDFLSPARAHDDLLQALDTHV